jgi:hypothetical protein
VHERVEVLARTLTRYIRIDQIGARARQRRTFNGDTRTKLATEQHHTEQTEREFMNARILSLNSKSLNHELLSGKLCFE